MFVCTVEKCKVYSYVKYINGSIVWELLGLLFVKLHWAAYVLDIAQETKTKVEVVVVALSSCSKCKR